MKPILWRAGGMMLALVVLTAACSKSSSTDTTGSSPGGASGSTTMQIGSDTANNKGSEDVSSSTSTEVEADDFYFKPTVLTGKPGQKLEIDLSNDSSATTHNFSIDAQKISQDLTPGGSAKVTVTFPDSGFVEFYCKFHRGSGMVGELTTG